MKNKVHIWIFFKKKKGRHPKLNYIYEFLRKKNGETSLCLPSFGSIPKLFSYCRTYIILILFKFHAHYLNNFLSLFNSSEIIDLLPNTRDSWIRYRGRASEQLWYFGFMISFVRLTFLLGYFCLCHMLRIKITIYIC